MEKIYEKITQKTEEISEKLIAIRRDLHSHPEKGWEEVRTSSIIANYLDELGFKVLIGEEVCDADSRMGVPSTEVLEMAYERALKTGAIEKYAKHMRNGMTGVIGIMEFEKPGPVVGMRFDIDALPLKECQDEDHLPYIEGFRSTFEGNMHACGHDGHTTIGLGVAMQLAELKSELRGKAILIFQPAEEGVRGAKSIVEKGHLDEVKYFLASHITKMPEGEEFDLFPGSGGALATTKLNVNIKGKSSHAAGSPESGSNAALAMATAIMNIYSIARHSKGTTRVNVGVANAGTGRNIIADEAYMEIETRGSTTDINKYVRDYAIRIIKDSSQMHGCVAETEMVGEAYSLESDPEMMEILDKASKSVGLKTADNPRMNLGGSEDVSYMMERVQKNGGIATFMRLTVPVKQAAHNVAFDFNERALLNGVNAFTACTALCLKEYD